MSNIKDSVDVPLVSGGGEAEAGTSLNYSTSETTPPLKNDQTPAAAAAADGDGDQHNDEHRERQQQQLTWRQCPRQSSYVAAVVGSISAIISIVVFSIPSAHAPFTPSQFLPTQSSFDVAIVDVMRTIAVTFLLYNLKPVAALQAVSFFEIVIVGKLFCLDWSRSHAHGDKVVALATLIATIIMQVGCISTTAWTSDAKGITPSGLWQVCRYYVLPPKRSGKLWAALLWIIIIAAQGSKILAPLQLAKIIMLLGGNADESSSSSSEKKSGEESSVTTAALETTTSTTLMTPLVGANTTTTTAAPAALLSTTQTDIVWAVLLYALLMFLPKLLAEFRDLVYVQLWQSGYRALQEDTYRYVLSLRLDWHIQSPVGETVKIVSDAVSAADELCYGVFVHLAPALFLAVSAFVVFVAHLNQPLLAGLAWCGFNLYLFFTVLLVNAKQSERDELAERIAQVRGRSVECLVGVEAIKTYQLEWASSKWLANSLEAFIHTYMDVRLSHSVIDIVQNCIVGATRALVLTIAAVAVLRSAKGEAASSSWISEVTNPLTVGSIIAVKELLEKVFEPLFELAQKIVSMVQALLDLKDLIVLLGREDLLEKKPPADGIDLAALPCHGRLCKTVTAEDGTQSEMCLLRHKGLSVEFRNVSFTYPHHDRHHNNHHPDGDDDAGEKKREDVEKAQKLQKKNFSDSDSNCSGSGADDDGEQQQQQQQQRAKKNEKPGLKNVSFFLPSGYTMAIVGPSGAYKSTIVKLLLQFYDNYEGEILIGGKNIKDCRAVRTVCALVPQEPHIFDGSLHANLIVGAVDRADPDADEVRQVIEKVKLGDVAARMGSGENGGRNLGQRGGHLSGGEKQRIAIARALLRRPRIIIADEATASLDAATEKEIERELLDSFAMDGRSGIVIAHRLTQAASCDSILVLDKGCVVQQGTHAELLADSNGLYHSLWTAQHHGNVSFAAAPAAKVDLVAAAASAAAESSKAKN